MESVIVTNLIDEIVESVYPGTSLVRERYMLSQSLHLLVFLVKRKSARDRGDSVRIMRNAIRNMMR